MIGVTFGGWSTNMGNSFFQLGAMSLLRDRLGLPVTPVGEQSGHPMYWNRRGGAIENALEHLDLAAIDTVVILGPVLRREFRSIWANSLRLLQKRGVRIVLLGTGAMHYDETTLADYRQILKEFRVSVLATRDTTTFEALGDLADAAYDGIDLGFFISEAHEPAGLRGGPYVALNFDKVPEPEISLGRNGDGGADIAFEFQGDQWNLRVPGGRHRLARMSRYLMMLEGIVAPRAKGTRIGRYEILRTEHRSNPVIVRKSFRGPRTLLSDVPYPYLEIYNAAELTLSSRLHACVAALSYGRAAMLGLETARSGLLDRLGLDDVQMKPVRLSRERLDEEKDGLTQFLRQNL